MRYESGSGYLHSVAAFRSRQGASYALMPYIASGRLVPLLTPALFLEYEAVLKRPEQRTVNRMTLTDIDGFLAALSAAGHAVEVSFSWRPQLGDPNDEMVLEAAINGRAEALITHNIKDFSAAAPDFNMRVLTPGSVLKELQT